MYPLELCKKIVYFLVTCYGLVQALSHCLAFFNKMCSQDLLKIGRGSFTAAVLGMITKNVWVHFKGEY